MGSVLLTISDREHRVSREVLSRMPVFAGVFEVEDEIHGEYFVDRCGELFGDVLLYVEYDIVPSGELGRWELEHYGFGLDDKDVEGICERSGELASSVLSGECPFVVSACGSMFVTTRSRLSKICYFGGLFRNEGKLSGLSKGTRLDPFSCDISGEVFGLILSHLRDSRVELSVLSKRVLNVLGGLEGEELMCVDELVDVDFGFDMRLEELRMGNDEVYGSNGCLCELVATDIEDEKLVSNDGYLSHWTNDIVRYSIYSRGRRYVELRGEGVMREATILRNGDLISQAYISWRFTNKGLGSRVSMRSMLERDPLIALKLIDYVEVRIGGRIIDRVSGFQLYQVSTLDPNSKQRLLMDTGCVHIPFSYFMECGLALPLTSLAYNEVRVIVGIVEDVLPDGIAVSGGLYVTYVHLGNGERRMLVENPDQYLIRSYHRPEVCVNYSGGSEGVRYFGVMLIFQHPTLMLVFSLHKDDSNESAYENLDDLLSFKLMYTNRRITGHEGNRDVGLKLNKLDSRMLCDVDVPTYVINFSLDTFNQNKLSGSTNFSQINAELEVVCSDRVGCVRVWGMYYNWLMVHDGTGYLKFSN